MRILMITTIYPSDPGASSYLTSELADAWQKAGHEVMVVVLQWAVAQASTPASITFPTGVRVHYFYPPQLRLFGKISERLLRWGLSSWLRKRQVLDALESESFDLVFTYSPLTAIASLASHFTRAGKVASCVYVVDFFPIAHRDIGLIPRGPIFDLANWQETRLLRRFDAIACMSPANIAFLKAHYEILDSQTVFERRLWGQPPLASVRDRDAVRAQHGLDPKAKLALFGGQLVEGRGLDDIIGAARLAHQAGSDLHFLVLGDGRLRDMVEQEAASGLSNLTYLPPIDRDSYLQLASACDVGLVVTVSNTTVPTFPSKSIDYLRAGIPIAAATEVGTDFVTFIEQHLVGRATLAGDPAALLACVESASRLPGTREEIRDRCWQVCENYLSVDRAAGEIIETMAAVAERKAAARA